GLVDRHRRVARLHPHAHLGRRGSLRPRPAAHSDLCRLARRGGRLARHAWEAAPWRRLPFNVSLIGSPHLAQTVLAAPLRVACCTGTGVTHSHVMAASPVSPGSLPPGSP